MANLAGWNDRLELIATLALPPAEEDTSGGDDQPARTRGKVCRLRRLVASGRRIVVAALPGG